MDPTPVVLVVFAAAALIIAAVLLLWRDLVRGRTEEIEPEGLDLPAVLPPETVLEESWLDQLTAQTGSEFTSDTAVLLAILVALTLGGVLFVWRDDLLAGALGVVVGVLLVTGTLFWLRARRQRLIREQLPDVMELMARAVRAGESLDQAITLAGNSGFQPVANEFRYCASQMRMGLSLEASLRRLVGRAFVSETRILAMTLIVQRRRGGSLPTTLERLAHVFRDRANFYRQFRAATALGRGSATLIALIGLGLDAFVILGNSEYAAILLTTTAGRILLATAMALQVVGVTWALWLLRSNF